MSSRGRKRKADVAFAFQGSVSNSGDGSAQRSLRPRLNAAAVGASSSTPVSAVPSTGTGSVVSVAASLSAFKLAQQRQQAAELRRLKQQRKRAAKQRNKRTLHRARIKQRSEQAAAAAALEDPAHWEPVDPTHGNKHLMHLAKGKHDAELGEVEQHWQQTFGHGSIVSVHRIQNSGLHHRFERMRQNTPSMTEQVAYHGTRTNVPALIYDCPTGFDMSRGLHRPGSVTTPLTLGRLQCRGGNVVGGTVAVSYQWLTKLQFMCACIVAICGLPSMRNTAATATVIRSVHGAHVH
jgi:hypothetical protein